MPSKWVQAAVQKEDVAKKPGSFRGIAKRMGNQGMNDNDIDDKKPMKKKKGGIIQQMNESPMPPM